MVTRKKRNTRNSNIVVELLTLLNTVKIYHWSTPAFAEHKSTDELYASLTLLVDQFVEAWIGTHPQSKHIPSFTMKIQSCNAKTFVSILRSHMGSLSKYSLPPELTNIRDDILSELIKTIYLFTFR